MRTSSKRDADALLLLIQGYQVSRLLKAAADLGIADRIAPGTSVAAADLAAALSVKPRRLLRMCRALAAFGVFTVDASNRIGHSAKSLLLRTDASPTLHHMARFWPMPGNWHTWAEFDHALQGNGTTFEAALGMPRFAYLKEHPDEAALFHAAMSYKPDDPHAAVAESYDFSGCGLIVDVGGGNGTLLHHILSRVSQPTGITFDRDEVVAPAQEAAKSWTLGERHRFEAGDFLKRVPQADTYLLADVLGIGEQVAATMLRNCRAAIRPNGRLVIIDRVLDADPAKGNPIDFLTDVHFMLNFPDGGLRSAQEFEELLRPAGFHSTRVTATPSAVSIIEAVPT